MAGGVAPVVVIAGEPGIGKTRLALELAEIVRRHGGEVLSGCCYEGGEARPYAVWAEAISGYTRRVGRQALEDQLGEDVRWLDPLIDHTWPRGHEAISVPAGVARLRLAEILVRVLESFEHSPLVLLDDMHWAYPESLDLFSHVARLATGALILVCSRGRGLELGHPLAQRLAAVDRKRSCEYASLGSLSREQAGELLREAVGGPLDVAWADAAYRESGGNPFFLGELGRHLHDRGVTDGPLRLPASIRAAVGLRVAGLGVHARTVLQLASMFTGGFGFVELQSACCYDDDLLVDCLEEALAEELLCPVGNERYHFAHALIRQVLYESLSPSRRACLHRRLAEALERADAYGPVCAAGELVYQYHASATLPGAERGAMHALTAAESARSVGAAGDAVLLLRLGLDLVLPGDAEMEARMLGELAVASADAGLFDDATQSLVDAVSILEGEGAPGETIAALVYAVAVPFHGAFAVRSLRTIEPIISRTLATLEKSRGLAWARLKLLNRFARREVVGPIRTLRQVHFDPQAVDIARSEGTELDYANTIEAWNHSLVEVEELTARIDGWRDPVARLRALVLLVGYLTVGEPGSSPAADRLCAEACALADDIGLPPSRAAVRAYRAAVLGGRGEFDAATEQLDLAQGLLDGEAAAASLVALVRVLTAQHVTADWPQLANATWDMAIRGGHADWLNLAFAAFAAQACAIAGESDRAREILGHVRQLHSPEPVEPLVIGLAGAAVWELRAADIAAELLACTGARRHDWTRVLHDLIRADSG